MAEKKKAPKKPKPTPGMGSIADDLNAAFAERGWKVERYNDPDGTPVVQVEPPKTNTKSFDQEVKDAFNRPPKYNGKPGEDKKKAEDWFKKLPKYEPKKNKK